MVVLCCGSRNWSDFLKTRKVIASLLSAINHRFTVLHGGAAGADSLSGMAAHLLGLEIEIMRPDWSKHGRRAGMLRNTTMLERKPDYVIAFWDGVSRGTLDTIQKAVNVYRIPMIIVRSENAKKSTK